MNLPRIGILPAALLITSVPALHGQGTIVYHNPPDIPIFTEHVPYELDVDQNGTIDYRLITTGGDFTAYGIENNASLTNPERPPDLGAPILPLSDGEYIGPSLTPSRIWFETYSFEPVPGFPVTVPAYFHGCTTAWCIGAFHGVTAYWGVQFEIEGNLHYGWVQVEMPQLPGLYANGGTILDWAYNSIHGQPILAGQVPEHGRC
jgi:hypothetical protein